MNNSNNEMSNQLLVDAILRYKNGEQSAFNDIYDLTKKVVISNLKRFNLIESDMEDLMQDIYMQVSKKIVNIDVMKNPYGWVKTVTNNTALNFLNKSSTKHEQLFDISINQEGEEFDLIGKYHNEDFVNPGTILIPEDFYDKKETQSIILNFIEDLPPKQKEAFLLYSLNELSYDEIAKATNSSLSSVKQSIHVARAKLQDKIKIMEERDGIRLHSVAIVPFFVYLYWMYVESTTVSGTLDTIILSSISEGQTALASNKPINEVQGEPISKSGPVSGVKTVAGGVDGAATATGLSTMAKIIIGIVATGIIGGIILSQNNNVNNDVNTNTGTNTIVETTAEDKKNNFIPMTKEEVLAYFPEETREIFGMSSDEFVNKYSDMSLYETSEPLGNHLTYVNKYIDIFDNGFEYYFKISGPSIYSDGTIMSEKIMASYKNELYDGWENTQIILNKKKLNTLINVRYIAHNKFLTFDYKEMTYRDFIELFGNNGIITSIRRDNQENLEGTFDVEWCNLWINEGVETNGKVKCTFDISTGECTQFSNISMGSFEE